MPIFLAALLGGLVEAAGSMAGRALLSLGFGFVAYEGINTALDGVKSASIGYLQSLPANVIIVLSLMNIDRAMSLIFSAVLVRLLLNGLTSGTIKRLVAK